MKALRTILVSLALLLSPVLSILGQTAGDYIDGGNAKAAKGDLDGALADYNRAIELKPDFAKAYYRGHAKKDKGDLGGALADFSKAIEGNPKYGYAYQSRGCLRYDTRAFSAALVDFRKELDSRSGDSDFAHYRVWMIRARLGEQDAATQELRDYFDHRKTDKPDDWPAQIGRFLGAQLAENDFLKTAESTDRKKDADQHCEAWFYAGTVRLIAGDKAAAKDYFKKCVATGEKALTEYTSAEAELKHLLGEKQPPR